MESKNIITIILKESGSIAELKKDFKVYQKSINNILLDVLVPESLVESQLHTQYVDAEGFETKSGIYTACKIGAIYTESDGTIGKTTSYYLRFMKKIKTPERAFLLYERVLPNELIKVAGTGENAVKLIINVDNILKEQDDFHQPTLVSRLTSQICHLEVEESESLDNDEEIEETSELELLSAQVNTLLDEIQNKSERSETFLKYSISNPLPEDITYNKDGLKTRGILFLDETYNIKTKILEAAQPQKGAVFVSDFSTKDDQLIQTEVFIYQAGIAERIITINSDRAEVISIGEWQTKVDSFQGKEHFGRFLYIDKNGFVNLTDATKNFIVNNNGIQVSDDASTFNFSDNFNVIADDKERLNIDLSEKFKKEVADRDERILTNAENIAQEIEDRKNADKDLKNNLDALSEQTKNASRLDSGTVTDERLSSNVALKNKNNNFSAPQTFNGDVTINGNIIQKGETVETHAEEVFTKKDKIHLREGAVGGLAKGETAGIIAEKYDGEHDGGFDIDADGIFRIGDKGDMQPAATREETPNNDSFAIWNEKTKRYETDPEINRISFNAKADKSMLGTAAFSNDYTDLDNLPNIPDGVKLYDTPGVNEDGAMSQKAATDTFETKASASATYETKNNASNTYETKANVEAKIKKAITDIINDAPAEYNTFKELADYIASDKTAASTMLSDINNLKSGKVDKNQGTSNGNKILKIDSSGNVAPGEFKTYIETDENNEKWFVIEIEEG